MYQKKHNALGHPKAMIDFTEDMVLTLQKYFALFEVDGVVTIEVNEKGLWFIDHILNRRQFLGKATFSKKDLNSNMH